MYAEVSKKARKMNRSKISTSPGSSIKGAHLKNQNKDTARKVVAPVQQGKKKKAA